MSAEEAAKKPEEETTPADEEETAKEEESTAHFEPVVKLEEVDTRSGEEDEVRFLFCLVVCIYLRLYNISLSS